MKIKNECKYLLKYNTLKLRSGLNEKALEEHIGKLVKELSEAKTEIKQLREREKLARRLIKQYKSGLLEFQNNKKCK